MAEAIQVALKWVQNRWSKSPAALKAVYILLLALLVGFLVRFLPGFETLKEWYTHAHPDAQAIVLVVGLAALVGFLILALDRARRVEGLKEDIEGLKGEKAELQNHFEGAQAEAKQLQERWDYLLNVECRDTLWKRACALAPAPFTPKLNRSTRFLTVLNLKGGVGKTTLTGNLAACLANGEHPLRILLVDIDFQGTLGDATVDPELARLQRQNDSVVNALLDTDQPSSGLVARLAVPMNGAERVRVILWLDTLDSIEFRLQARFLLDAEVDPRFRFRTHLHQDEVFANFDVVIFDCPPRITTSVVNAITCSDYVLIPTKLDDGSIDAVPRTVAWMRSLGSSCQAEIVGVVASHTTVRVDKLVKADQQSYDRLRGVVQSECGEGLLFDTHIEHDKRALGPARGMVASATAKGREVFASVAEELRRRMKI